MLRVLGYSEQENPTFQSHPPELALWEFLVLWVKDTKFWPSQLNWSLPLFFLLGSSKEIFAGGKDELNWKGARTQSKKKNLPSGSRDALLPAWPQGCQNLQEGAKGQQSQAVTPVPSLRLFTDGLIWALGMKFAIEQINNSSSLLPGIRLGYDMYDTCFEPLVALQPSLLFLTRRGTSTIGVLCNYTEYQPRVTAVIGPHKSDLCLLTAKLFSSFLIPQVETSQDKEFSLLGSADKNWDFLFVSPV